MRPYIVPVVMLAGIAWLTSGPSAQGLGGVAKREAERRQQVSGGKKYTNEDLQAVSVTAPAPPAAPGPTASPAGAAGASAAAEDPKDGAARGRRRNRSRPRDGRHQDRRRKARRGVLARQGWRRPGAEWTRPTRG